MVPAGTARRLRSPARRRTDYPPAMPTAVDAVHAVTVAAAVGLAAAGVRVWRPRRRRAVTGPPVPAPSDGAEPPWAVVIANPTKIPDIDGEISWLEERS